jgi:hypothetical protein
VSATQDRPHGGLFMAGSFEQRIRRNHILKAVDAVHLYEFERLLQDPARIFGSDENSGGLKQMPLKQK